MTTNQPFFIEIPELDISYREGEDKLFFVLIHLDEEPDPDVIHIVLAIGPNEDLVKKNMIYAIGRSGKIMGAIALRDQLIELWQSFQSGPVDTSGTIH